MVLLTDALLGLKNLFVPTRTIHVNGFGLVF